MCIGSNSVNQAQDLMIVTKIEDLPNSLLPTIDIDVIIINFPYLPTASLSEVLRG